MKNKQLFVKEMNTAINKLWGQLGMMNYYMSFDGEFNTRDYRNIKDLEKEIDQILRVNGDEDVKFASLDKRYALKNEVNDVCESLATFLSFYNEQERIDAPMLDHIGAKIESLQAMITMIEKG